MSFLMMAAVLMPAGALPGPSLVRMPEQPISQEDLGNDLPSTAGFSGYSDEDMPSTMDSSSWHALVRSARVEQAFQPSISIRDDSTWTLWFPMWSGAEGGCPHMEDPGYERLYMLLTGGGQLCFAGSGLQSRAASTIAMWQEAASILRARGAFPKPFAVKLIGIGDDSPCKADFGYSTKCRGEFKMKLIPPFVFWQWPEAGILPNFTVAARNMERLSRKPAEERTCGWIGNPRSHRGVDEFEEVVRGSSSYVVRRGTRQMTLEKQTQQWACLIDIPCWGYSGRVPMLMHSGRPVVMLQRVEQHGDKDVYFVDNTWHGKFMEPWVHYIPLLSNFSNLKNVTSVALGDVGQKIAGNALRMARAKLTTDKAVHAMADLLLATKDEEPGMSLGRETSGEKADQ